MVRTKCAAKQKGETIFKTKAFSEKMSVAIKKKYNEDSNYGHKISESLKIAWKENPDKFSSGESHSKIVGNSTKNKYRGLEVKSILDVSSRTATKIIKRMNIGCCLCQWKNSTCDIHHINGKKIEDANNHNNLTVVCPNCHRMIHNGIIKKESIITLTDYIGDKWKPFYYG